MLTVLTVMFSFGSPAILLGVFQIRTHLLLKSVGGVIVQFCREAGVQQL